MADADFRPAQASDWSQIQRMCRDLYVEDVVGETMDDGKILRTLAHLVAHPDQGQAWVVVVDGRALGYAILIWFWSNEYGGLLGVVDEIWVEPEARGLGIGSGFLQALQHSRDDLVAGLIRHGHRHARALLSEDDLARLVREQAGPGDMVVCLGAGTISAWANNLPDRLRGAEHVR